MNAQPFPRRHRISVAEYHRMGEAGIFSEDDRVELIEGEIIDMAPIGTQHAETVRRFIHQLAAHIPEGILLDVQNPIRLDAFNEPQPDLTLIRAGDYSQSHPTAEDVLLLIEVADTSRDYDRQVKIPLYARHGIPEVWLVDLKAGVIEVFREPAAEGYRRVTCHRPGEPVTAEGVTGVRLDPAAVLPTP